MVLRAKGVVEGEDGSWIHFDHVPGEADVRTPEKKHRASAEIYNLFMNRQVYYSEFFMQSRAIFDCLHKMQEFSR